MIKSSITDKPKGASERDSFGIEPFEKGLTNFIETSNTPITVALQGEWGSGKTSLMNSLEKSLGNPKTNQNPNSKYHSVWLNTWEFALMKDAQSTLMDIILGLIKEVTTIAQVDATTTKKMFSKMMNITKSVTKTAAQALGNKVYDGLGDAAMNEFMSEQSSGKISEIRDELESIIKTCIDDEKNKKQGFIFFIDDLDRIDPPVAVQLLELLKNIFTLDNCVFVLAIDYDVVVKGLEPKFGKLTALNEREFRSFFDKIIQVPFSMPVSSYRADDFLKASLLTTNYLNEKQANNEELITKLSEISDLSVGKNPRALKRLMNSLSLIKHINFAKGNSPVDDNLNEELELIINFALVSIQIAYPPVYRLLAQHSGFDKWDESIALQMNLKELDLHSIEKLKSISEFDEDWEQILFRICENDHYLKKRALSLSRLLNSLKDTIIENKETVEEIVGSVISLSAVTNLEAFDEPVQDYNRGQFLKQLRHALILQLRENLPELGNIVKEQGKTVRKNAYIKFTEKDGGHFVKLNSHPFEGGVRLIATSNKYIAPIDNHSNFLDAVKEAGLENEYNEVANSHTKFTHKFPDFKIPKFDEHVAKRENCYILELYSYFTLPNLKAFNEEDNIKYISHMLTDFYHFLVELHELCDKVWIFYRKQ